MGVLLRRDFERITVTRASAYWPGRRVANGFLCDVVPGTINARAPGHPPSIATLKWGPSIAVTGDRRHQNESCEGRCAALRRQPRWSRGLGMEVKISRLTWATGVTLFGAGWRGCCA
jgi:hypothetical protein